MRNNITRVLATSAAHLSLVDSQIEDTLEDIFDQHRADKAAARSERRGATEARQRANAAKPAEKARRAQRRYAAQ